MIVFKTFWSIVKKYKITIILYTALLILFGALYMSTSDNGINFIDTKPNILIINNDTKNLITDNLIKYIESNSNIINIENEDLIDDALFYKDINYIIDIPSNYGRDILKGHNPEIVVKQTGDYKSSLAEMILSRYIQVQNIYSSKSTDENELIELINDNIDKKSNIKIESKLDIVKTSNIAFYFNFASYSIMTTVIFIVCLVLSSFKETNIDKKIDVSSISNINYNKYLLLSSLLYSIIVWFLFVILGVIILGNIMFTLMGLIYIINLLLFTLCSLTLALLISKFINDKKILTGVVNVIAIGFSFISGGFVQAKWLPHYVLDIAHILPNYWYINSNELLKEMEDINVVTLQPIFINMLVIILFSVLFVLINSVITRYKSKT
ncbi:MAG: ABC transporter permease [Clostridium sp.]|nr:ABC transporter permease [Clostridium sp.]MCM1444707.1 ABC transporter permease [Candidatus Amulumruptor caecigallinarius]